MLCLKAVTPYRGTKDGTLLRKGAGLSSRVKPIEKKKHRSDRFDNGYGKPCTIKSNLSDGAHLVRSKWFEFDGEIAW